MKFEMSIDEFRSFCEQVHHSAQVHELELSLEDSRAENNAALAEKRRAWDNVDRLDQENKRLRDVNTLVSNEIGELKRLVKDLQDQLVPFRKERKLSEIFKFYVTQRIYAIKAVRELYNIGLKEAKETIEGVAPKHGSFSVDVHRELNELALIFSDWHKASPDVQRERLRPFVSVEASVDIASILNGTFDGTLAVETNTVTSAGVGSEAGDGLQG